MYCYFISLIFSLFSLIMSIIMAFNNLKFFGFTELYTCIGISIILMIIGLITDKERNNLYVEGR